MSGRWFWYLTLEVWCTIAAVWLTFRVALDLITGHYWWALLWAVVCVGNAWAARSHRASRILTEQRLDRENRRG